MDVQLFLILFALAAFVFFSIRYRERIGQELLIAFLIALAWTSFYEYVYDGFVGYFIGSINIFTLIFHTSGLVILREVYEHIRGSFWKKFSYSMLLYWLFLGLIEGKLSRKGPKVAEMNKKAFQLGYDYCSEHYERHASLAFPDGLEEKITITGNTAIAQGALDCGLKFFAGYPITPATTIIRFVLCILCPSLLWRREAEQPVPHGTLAPTAGR